MTKVKTMAVLSTTVLAALGLVSCGNNNTNSVLEQALPKVMFNVTELTEAKDVARVVTVDDATINVTWAASDERVKVEEKNATLWTINPEIPAYGEADYKFNLTATLEYNGATTTKEWKDIIVKASTVDPSTVKNYETVSALFEARRKNEFKLQEDGDLITVTGVVGEYVYFNNNPDGFYLTDGVKSILVYGGLKDKVYEIGDKVEVSGKLTKYGEILQFNYQKKTDFSTSIKKVGTGTERLPAAVASSVKELTEVDGTKDYDKYGLYYTVTGTVAKDATEKYPYQLKATDTDKLLTFYTNSMKSTSTAAIDAMVGKKVTLNVIYYGFSSSQYRVLFLGEAADITEAQMTDEEKANGAVAQAEALFETEYTKDTEVELPATLEGATLTWSVEADSKGVVIEANKAKITRGDEKQTGKVKVAADVNGKKAEKVITFTIAAARPPLTSVATILANEEVTALSKNFDTTKSTFAAVGKVKSIDTPYDAEKNYVSFILTDGTGDILVYCMTGGATLKVGDFIAVQGKITIYNSVKEFAKGCEEATSYIKTSSEILELAKDLADGKYLLGNCFVRGTIKKIDTPYDSEKKCISFTITDGTSDLTVYKMNGGETLKEGDEVILDTPIKNFKGTIESEKGNLVTTIVTPAAAE